MSFGCMLAFGFTIALVTSLCPLRPIGRESGT